MTTLLVRANPYTFVDHKGRPAGAVPCDPVAHTPDRRWVGAVAVSEVVEARDKSIDSRHPLQDTWFLFSADAQKVPDSPHYRAAIRSGDLIAADESTAAVCGVAYEDPEDVLERWKQRAESAHPVVQAVIYGG